jgi:hypothetical protein
MAIGAILAGVGLATNLVSGFMGSKSAKKQQGQANALQARQIALMEEQVQNFKNLIKDLPKQTQDYMDKIGNSFLEISALLNEAKLSGDEQSAQIFQSQRDMVESHFAAETEAIGLNTQEMLGSIEQMSNAAMDLVNQDEDIKDEIRKEYKVEADKAVNNLSKMAEASGQRIDNILKTGLPEGAAANISKISQGVSDLKRKTMDFEAARGKGGAASRGTAVDLEGLKLIGETTANLRAQARGELVQEGQIQGQLQQAAGNRAQMLQPTRGAATLLAKQPYDMAALNVQDQAGSRQLTALGNKNVGLRQLTGAEGEASLAREQEYMRDRMSLEQGKNAQEMSIMEREQDLKGAYTAQQAGQARSVADILGAQAQNYSNMAQQSRATAMAAYGTAAKTGMGMVAGYNGAFGGEAGTWKAAGEGGMYTGMGVMPKSYMDMLMPKDKVTS